MIKHLKGISDEELENSILNTDDLIEKYLYASSGSAHEKKLLRLIMLRLALLMKKNY